MIPGITGGVPAKQRRRIARLETQTKKLRARLGASQAALPLLPDPRNPATTLAGGEYQRMPHKQSPFMSSARDRGAETAVSTRDPAPGIQRKRTAEQAQLESATRPRMYDPAATSNFSGPTPMVGQFANRPVTGAEVNQLASRFQNLGDPPSPLQLEAAGERKPSLAAAIFVPVEPFDPDEEGATGRDGMLREVITNLEAHNAKVRVNIAALASRQSTAIEDHIDGIRKRAEERAKTRTRKPLEGLLANLNTPHNPANGSPAVPKMAPLPVDTSQAVEEYNRNAEMGIAPYRQALERRGSLGGNDDDDSRRSNAADIPIVGAPLAQRASVAPMRGSGSGAATTNGGADVVVGGTDESLSSTRVDVSRDPRRR